MSINVSFIILVMPRSRPSKIIFFRAWSIEFKKSKKLRTLMVQSTFAAFSQPKKQKVVLPPAAWYIVREGSSKVVTVKFFASPAIENFPEKWHGLGSCKSGERG